MLVCANERIMTLVGSPHHDPTIAIFALLGMSLFGRVFTSEAGFDEPPRANFDSIVLSMVRTHE